MILFVMLLDLMKRNQIILNESGVPDEITTKIEKSYAESFGDTPPVADILIDNKALAAKAQKKKEEMLEKQVRILENKLERVTQDNSLNTEAAVEVDSNNLIEENENNTFNDNLSEVYNNYDIVLQVKPEKVSKIKSEIINGQKCIIIPVDEDEHTNVNGVENLI